MQKKKKITATGAAVISVNTSYSKEISAKKLVAIFKGGVPLTQWQSHVGVFFSELPDGVIQEFMTENNITIDMMNNVYSALPPVLQSKKFKAV